VADISILHYRTIEGRFPYREWVESIADKAARAAVLARVDRLTFGTFGDWKAVGEGCASFASTSGPATGSISAGMGRRW
jgi:putative addiction module killer protein